MKNALTLAAVLMLAVSAPAADVADADHAVKAAAPAETERVEVPVIGDETLARVEKLVTSVRDAQQAFTSGLGEFLAAAEKLVRSRPRSAPAMRDWISLEPSQPKPIEETPIVEPPAGCQCGCGSPTCKCGRPPGAAGDLPGLLQCVSIEWDEQALQIVEAAAVAAAEAEPEPRRVQVEFWTADWCKVCGPLVESTRSYVEQTKHNGKSVWEMSPTPRAHIRLMDYDLMEEEGKARKITILPTIIFLIDGEEVERYTQFPGKEFLIRRINELFRGLEPLPPKAPPPAVGAINAGQITFDKGWVTTIRSVAGVLKGVAFKNDAFEQAYGDATVKLPARLNVDIALTADNCRFVFPDPPSLKYGLFLNQPLEAISVRANSLTLELPGYFAPDIVLRFKQ